MSEVQEHRTSGVGRWVTAPLYLQALEPNEVSSGWLAHLIYQHGRCASSRIDPDQWFPTARDPAKARQEAAEAIAVCAACPVRSECLEFALRHGSSFGGHGVWGGMVEADRRLLRLGWLHDSSPGSGSGSPAPVTRRRARAADSDSCSQLTRDVDAARPPAPKSSGGGPSRGWWTPRPSRS